MTRRILLVEDDPNFRTVLALALELQGYLVSQAPGGHCALDLLEREVPDIIISDLEMGGMDGRSLCKHTRAHTQYSSIPFVILSAFVNPGEPGTLTDLPADCCLSKQIPVADLTRLIKELLDRSEKLRKPPAT